MARVMPIVTRPIWSRYETMRTSGLLYNSFFVSDRALRHVREHAVYGPAERGNSHFFLKTKKIEEMEELHAIYDSIFTYRDHEHRDANIAILSNLKRLADLRSSQNQKHPFQPKITLSNGRIVIDSILYTDAFIGTAPVLVKGKKITVHEHTGGIRMVTEPQFITEDNFGVFPVVTAFPFIWTPPTANPKESEALE